VGNEAIYIASQSYAYALNINTGAKLWRHQTGAGYPRYSSPAVANGMVYVGSGDGNVYALKASTGARVRNYNTFNNVGDSPALANGVIYVGTYNWIIYALNARTGAELWGYHTGGAVSSSPAVANGAMYVGSTDGNLYAFGLK
jgi:eukaryotic-like serine/threonine-protein kinase